MHEMGHDGGPLPGTGDVNTDKNGFDPAQVLTDFIWRGIRDGR
jgi:hypothetical protein